MGTLANTETAAITRSLYQWRTLNKSRASGAISDTGYSEKAMTSNSGGENKHKDLNELPSTLSEAKEKGSKYYFTGSECKYGHISSRLTTNGTCVECENERRERIKKIFPDRENKRSRDWYKNNREKQLKRGEEWRDRDRIRHRELQKIYQAQNLERHRYIQATRRASKAERIPKWCDLDAVKSIYMESRRITMDTGIEHHVDHVYPLQGKSVSGLHVPENLQVVPSYLNLSKSNKLPEDFYGEDYE